MPCGSMKDVAIALILIWGKEIHPTGVDLKLGLMTSVIFFQWQKWECNNGKNGITCWSFDEDHLEQRKAMCHRPLKETLEAMSCSELWNKTFVISVAYLKDIWFLDEYFNESRGRWGNDVIHGWNPDKVDNTEACRWGGADDALEDVEIWIPQL